MKVILLNNAFYYEIQGRCQYFKDIFQVPFKSQKRKGYIELVPDAPCNASVLFVIGHNNRVGGFLSDYTPATDEKIVVLITCTLKSLREIKKKFHRVYMSSENGLTSYYSGRDYGFEFPVSEAELKFYNSKEQNLKKRLNHSFYNIK